MARSSTKIACRILLAGLIAAAGTAPSSAQTSNTATDPVGSETSRDVVPTAPNLFTLPLNQNPTNWGAAEGETSTFGGQYRINLEDRYQRDSFSRLGPFGENPDVDIFSLDNEAVSRIDVTLDGERGAALIGSFGLSSQPRDIDPSDAFLLRGNVIREDKAVANIGIRF